MKVIEKNKENEICFDEIDVGNVFKNNNELFMKIYSEAEDAPDNAVSLRTGMCEYFDDCDLVEIVNNAKVIIGD